MKVLLDECLPKRLSLHLSGHDVLTVPQAGLAGYSNGKLLSAIDEQFDAFITIDGNLEWQQNLEGRSFIVVVLRAPSNRIDDLIPVAPKIIEALKNGSDSVRHVQK